MKLLRFSLLCSFCLLLAACNNGVPNQGNWDSVETLYTSGGVAVTGVAFEPERTVLHMSLSGQPGNNFTIQPNAYIVADGGKEYTLLGAEGITPGQWSPYPENGHAEFDLYFSPIRRRTRALDFVEPRSWVIYGIHDSGKPFCVKPIDDSRQAVYDENEFFKKGTGVFKGKFEGQSHPELFQYFGYSAFQDNNLQHCNIAGDGSFTMEIPLEYPVLSYMWDDSGRAYYFFLEAGGEAEMHIDSTGIVRYDKSTRCGKLSQWMCNALPVFCYPVWDEDWEQTSFEEFTIKVANHFDVFQRLADYVSPRYGFSPEETHHLKQMIRLNAAAEENSADLYGPSVRIVYPVDSARTQRLKDLSDPSLYRSTASLDPGDWTAYSLIPNGNFFNRYQFSPLMRPFDVAHMVSVDSGIFHRESPSIFLQAAFQNERKMQSEMRHPSTKLVIMEDGIMRTETVDYTQLWKERLDATTSPYLKARLQEIINRYSTDKPTYYTLPEGEATDIFNELVKPFKGKWVFVEFWATSCGPCVEGIKASVDLRKKIAAKDNLQLVFITTDKLSPKKAFDDFSAEYLAGEVNYYIPATQYMQLSELFNFNGIPHAELVAPDGRVVKGAFLPRFEYTKIFFEELERAIPEE